MTKVPHLTFTELQEVSIEDLQRVWHASTERSPFRILGIVSFGTSFALIVEPICPNTSFDFLDFFTSNIHRYFLDFAF